MSRSAKNSPSTNETSNEDNMSLKTSKSKPRAKKRKRQDSESSTDMEDILPDNTWEVEKNVHASAIKNNLDDVSVKKILKKVVTNDHVLALVKFKEDEDNSGTEHKALQQALTRAKAKELMKAGSGMKLGSPKSAPWSLELTPIKEIPVKTRPEVKALIAQELPDDEDDEEYEPAHDDVPSDDDHILSESCSDLDSQPRTPATPRLASPRQRTDGPFKVPQDMTPARKKLILDTEEATIALRTRSKLSLSGTPIEHIESSFVPPDELMPVVDDHLWNEFLSDCLNPASVSRHEDDDEADPEYNVAADPDAHDEDEEALDNFGLRISRRELNDLVTELFSVMPDAADDALDDIARVITAPQAPTTTQPQWEGKQEPLSDDENITRHCDKIVFKNDTHRYSIGKMEIGGDEGEMQVVNGVREREKEIIENMPLREINNVSNAEPVLVTKPVTVSVEETSAGVVVSEGGGGAPALLRVLAEARTDTTEIRLDEAVELLPAARQILQQQLRQHIQLCASNFLQLYVHPTHWKYAPPYKQYLEQLQKISQQSPNSVASVCNLQPALELVRGWELAAAADTPENQEMVKFIQSELERGRRRYNQNNVYVGEFPEMFKQVVANSPVFLYPYLLPGAPYRADGTRRFSYTRSEDHLIVMGLDMFWDYIEANPQLYKPKARPDPNHRYGLRLAAELLCRHMLPHYSLRHLLAHIHKARSQKITDGVIPKYFATREVEPVQHQLLPYNAKLTLYEQPEHEMPRIWVRYLAKTSKRFRDHLYKPKHSGAPPSKGVLVNLSEAVTPIIKQPLPIDFTKTIVSHRINVREKIPKTPTTDKFDIHIVPSTTTTVAATAVIDISPAVTTDNKDIHDIPEDTTSVTTNTKTTAAAKKIIVVDKDDEGNTVVMGSLIPCNVVYGGAGDKTSKDGDAGDNSTPTSEVVKEGSGNNTAISITPGNIITIGPIGATPIKTPRETSAKRKSLLKKSNILPTLRPRPNKKDEVERTGDIVNIKNPVTDKPFTPIAPKTPTTSNGILEANTPTSGQPTSDKEAVAMGQSPRLIPNAYRLVKTTTGQFLVPIALLQSTSTVNSVTTPITSSAVQQLQKADIDTSVHCKCCLLLRKICKWQAKMTDFFAPKTESLCDCKDRRYPKVSRRLRMLLNNFKSKSWSVHRELLVRMKAIERARLEGNVGASETETGADDLDDLAAVTSYQLNLTFNLNVIRNCYLKKKVSNILTKFDPDDGDPLSLTEDLFKAFDVDAVDLYKEFLGFLTPVQVDSMNKFKDYFVQRCAHGLIKRIDEEVKDIEKKATLLTLVQNIIWDSKSSSCEMCCSLLSTLRGYPKLAKYVFDLFPHRAKTEMQVPSKPLNQKLSNLQKSQEALKFREIRPRIIEASELVSMDRLPDEMGHEDVDPVSVDPESANPVSMGPEDVDPVSMDMDSEDMETEGELTICDESLAAADYEADHSSSGDEMCEYELTIEEENVGDADIKDEIDETDDDMSESADCDEMSESFLLCNEQIKADPAEWKRDDDKIILETLMPHLTPNHKEAKKTVLEILEEKNIYQDLLRILPDRSVEEIRTRATYLLEILVMNKF